MNFIKSIYKLKKLNININIKNQGKKKEEKKNLLMTSYKPGMESFTYKFFLGDVSTD